MNRNTFNIIIGLTLILGLFLSCGNKPKNTKAEQDYQKAARYFVADESFSPILNEALDVFLYKSILDTLEAKYTNEQDAVKELMALKTWLAFTTRDFTAKERQNLIDRKYLPRTIPIAYDGLAIIVNNTNPDTCITVKDFKRILKGEVTQWKDLYPTSKLGNIDVVFDNPLSSTVRWCVDSLLGGKEFSAPNIGAVNTSAAVIEYVENHKNSLGIIGSNWLNDKRDTTNVTFRRNIDALRKGCELVLIDVPPEVIYERLKYDTTRPLLQCEDKMAAIRDLYARRDSIYREAADHTVNGDQPRGFVALDIMKAVGIL